MNAPLHLSIPVALAAAAFVAMCASPASAQTPAATAPAFGDLSQVIKPGLVVIVIDEKGDRTKGTITSISDSVVEVRRYGRVIAFPADRVTRISKLDSRRDGFGLGFLAGGVVGGYLGVETAEFCSDFGSGWGSTDNDDGCPWAIPTLAGIFGMVGGGIGALIDNFIDGETTVFERPRAAAQLRVAPVIRHRTAAVHLTLRF